MRNFNFVNFENLLYMKLYSLRILNKVVPYNTDGQPNAGPTASTCGLMVC